MSLLAAIVLAALVLEDDDLLALAVLHHLRRDRGTAEQWRAYLDLVVRRAQQHFVEGHRLSRLDVQRRHPKGLPRLGTELLPPGADDRVHVEAGSYRSESLLRNKQQDGNMRPGTVHVNRGG